MISGTKPIRSFGDLEVFKKAYDVSLEIHKTSLNFPKIEQFALGDQIRRASKSICANVAEGFAKQRESSAEFKRYLLIAIGSAEEMQVWVRYCKDLGYVDKSLGDGWIDSYREIAKMLHGLRTNWR